jgi:phosphatidylcholine synthase
MAFLVIATFLPIHVMHPVRVERLRRFNIAVVLAGCLLAAFVVFRNFDVPTAVTAALCLIAVYILLSDPIIRIVRKAMR